MMVKAFWTCVINIDIYDISDIYALQSMLRTPIKHRYFENKLPLICGPPLFFSLQFISRFYSLKNECIPLSNNIS